MAIRHDQHQQQDPEQLTAETLAVEAADALAQTTIEHDVAADVTASDTGLETEQPTEPASVVSEDTHEPDEPASSRSLDRQVSRRRVPTWAKVAGSLTALGLAGGGGALLATRGSNESSDSVRSDPSAQTTPTHTANRPSNVTTPASSSNGETPNDKPEAKAKTAYDYVAEAEAKGFQFTDAKDLPTQIKQLYGNFECYLNTGNQICLENIFSDSASGQELKAQLKATYERAATTKAANPGIHYEISAEPVAGSIYNPSSSVNSAGVDVTEKHKAAQGYETDTGLKYLDTVTLITEKRFRPRVDGTSDEITVVLMDSVQETNRRSAR